MRDIDGYQGSFIVKCAFKLSPLLFVRPGELRKMEWAAVNLDATEWTYFITKTEMHHIVPLARQAVETLREIHALTGREKYVFHGERDHDRPMSNNAIRSALRRLSWSNDEITPHGFRAMAFTILDNMSYKQEWLERQLAHEEANKVKAAYKREMWRMYLPGRHRHDAGMGGLSGYPHSRCASDPVAGKFRHPQVLFFIRYTLKMVGASRDKLSAPVHCRLATG